MACTRFNYDECRTKKRLQQSTDPGRWILNVPGNGSTPDYIADPHIILQKWGANLQTNTVDLEGQLWGINRYLGKDCININNYNASQYKVNSNKITYSTNNNLTTEQSRTIAPAWTIRDSEQVNWYYPHLNPQENICLPFLNNINTRLIERDNYYSP